MMRFHRKYFDETRREKALLPCARCEGTIQSFDDMMILLVRLLLLKEA
jgi:hypothetical protein